MSDTAVALWLRLAATAALTPAFYYGFDAFGVPVHWLIAVVLAALLVFGGWLVIAWADDF